MMSMKFSPEVEILVREAQAIEAARFPTLDSCEEFLGLRRRALWEAETPKERYEVSELLWHGATVADGLLSEWVPLEKA